MIYEPDHWINPTAFYFAQKSSKKLQTPPKTWTQGATQASGYSLLAGAFLTPLSRERWQAPNNGDRPVLSISRPNPARPAAQPRNIATPAKNAQTKKMHQNHDDDTSAKNAPKPRPRHKRQNSTVVLLGTVCHCEFMGILRFGYTIT